MAIENRLTTFLNKRTWIIPVLFSFMCLFFVLTIVGIEIRRVDFVETTFAFSIGGELCAMAVAIMMTLSILPAYKRQSGYIRVFVTLLFIGCSVLFFDSMQMLVDGVAELRGLNTILSIFVFISSLFFLYFFFLYAGYALKSEGKTMNLLNYIAIIALAVFCILPFINYFYPLYFTIGEDGVYARNNQTWWISRLFDIYIVIITIVGIILSKEKVQTKIIIAVFILLPVLAYGSGGYQYGALSIQYTTMMVSLVLMYALLYSKNERNLYSTNKELSVATNIQKHMLPSIFPAFPERKEFDVYASMNPAKEVGGDFYDFFLIDENHLGLVMADVSDKGIPAALLMMASKIMVQNYAMLGQSPKDVLTSVNKQICTNNQEEMFVTIWLGILDLKTGLLTASNAGHEKPVIKNKDGDFELFADKHGFVVGWDPTMKYSEYKIQLKKGSKLFIYTDGVPEASNGVERFGFEKMVSVLNENKDKDPQTIIGEMSRSISDFVGLQEQFDDITMLCLEFKGYNDEK